MKKRIAIVLLMVCILSLPACVSKKGQAYLNAVVLEITETEILAQCLEESTGQLTGTEISISKEVVSGDGIPEIAPESTIRVVYEFNRVKKLEDPVKIDHVYAIYLLDEKGEVIPNAGKNG